MPIHCEKRIFLLSALVSTSYVDNVDENNQCKVEENIPFIKS